MTPTKTLTDDLADAERRARASTISFFCPLPPAALRSNTRAKWWERTKAKQAYSEAVYDAACQSFFCRVAMAVEPWKRARVVYEWRYCGTAPDLANIGANTKALQDILCCAPNIGLKPNNTTYLGLVEDDKGIVPAYRLVKVAHRSEQGVHITIEQAIDTATPATEA